MEKRKYPSRNSPTPFPNTPRTSGSTSGHEQILTRHGVKAETIQSAARIAAVIKAVATVHATL